MNRSRVKVASFRVCDDSTCEIVKGLHPLIDISQVNLTSNVDRTVAISYTWGEFQRTRVEIGHDGEGKIYTMELGLEWDVSEFRNKLVSICTRDSTGESTTCWIDQLCIAQNDEVEIRETLAKIPDIYKRFKVIVLMPGGICSCLKVMQTHIQVAKMRGRTDALPQYKLCVNATGFCSYFDRVWTRQEFLYSRSVRIERTNPSPIPCVKNAYEAYNLAPFARRLLARLEADRAGTHEEPAWKLLEQKGISFISRLVALLLECKDDDDAIRDMTTTTMSEVCNFLLGNTLTKGHVVTSTDHLKNFIRSLRFLSRSPRAATKAEDYVTSVWVDCPGYIIPEGYKSKGVPSLLEDALKQLERNHGVSVYVNSLGLSGSLLWRPSKYLEDKSITKMGDIYVARKWYAPLPVIADRDDAMPLHFNEHQKGPSLSSGVENLTRSPNLLPRLGSSLFTELFKNWAVAVTGAVRAEFDSLLNGLANQRKGSLPQKDGNHYFYAGALCMKAFHYKHDYILDLDRNRPDESDESRYEQVYQLVAWALGMDLSQCKSRGLNLVMSLQDPPRIGLMKASQDGYNQDNLVTVAVGKDSSGTSNKNCGVHLLEGYKRRKSEATVIEIIGAWVPMVDLHGFKPNGWVVYPDDHDEINAYLYAT